MKKLMQRLTRRAISEVCYWLCEHLEEHTERVTTGTVLAAGDAVAVSRMLDWRRALNEDQDKLPTGIATTLAAFSAEDWHEVMSSARLVESGMVSIDRPEWAHLRRQPITSDV